MADPAKITDAEFQRMLIEFLRNDANKKLLLGLLGIPDNIREQLQVLQSEKST